MKLELVLDSDRATPGGQIRGLVRAFEGGRSRSLVVTVILYEKSRDYLVAAGTSSLVLHQGDVQTGDSYEFELALAEDAVPSTKTKNGELYYELAVQSDEPGLDTHVARRLEVG